METTSRAHVHPTLLHRIAIGILVLFAIVAAGLAGIPAASATSGDAGGDPITWAVGPSNETAPDGRSWVELKLDPGAGASDRFAVRNLGNREVTFALTAADGYLTPTGRFNMLPSDKKSVDSGTWISMDKTVTVAAGGTAVVPFTVTVPANATPGDHAAGIAASIFSEGAPDGARVGVESRIGFRVMTRVAGEVQPRLEVQAAGGYDGTWNPFQPGSATIAVDLVNSGNVRLTVDASAMFNGVRAPSDGTEAARPIELLPGDRRTIQLHEGGVWPLGIVSVPVTVAQGVTALDGSVNDLDPIVRDVAIWAIPWPQMIVLLALALVVFGIFWGRRRRSKELARLVAEARETGRREAELQQEVV